MTSGSKNREKKVFYHRFHIEQATTDGGTDAVWTETGIGFQVGKSCERTSASLFCHVAMYSSFFEDVDKVIDIDQTSNYSSCDAEFCCSIPGPRGGTTCYDYYHEICHKCIAVNLDGLPVANRLCQWEVFRERILSSFPKEQYGSMLYYEKPVDPATLRPPPIPSWGRSMWAPPLPDHYVKLHDVFEGFSKVVRVVCAREELKAPHLRLVYCLMSSEIS